MWVVATLEVLLEVFFEVSAVPDLVDGWLPSRLPVVGDVEDVFHEDLEVDENSALQILANIVVVIASNVVTDSVRVAFLLQPDG
jgi:hypothetical protein